MLRAIVFVRPIVGLTLAFATAAAQAAPGDLDSSFGGTGKITTPIGTSTDRAHSLAVQADGKIVAAGVSYDGSDQDFAVVRYDPDGSLDGSFGGTGKITTLVGAGGRISSVALQADEKIVVAGRLAGGKVAIVRYDPDGTLDSSFGGAGKVITPIGAQDPGPSVVLQADGKILAVGGWGGEFAIVRYDPDGTLDSSFGEAGTANSPVGCGGLAHAVAVQPDGKILAAGFCWNGNDSDFGVVRYDPDGTLDTTFGGTGSVTTPIGAFGDEATALTVQPDGKILVTGTTKLNQYNQDHAHVVVRYDPDGTLDATFGCTGKVITPIENHLISIPSSLALQADGKIVAAGTSYVGGLGFEFAVVRYNPNGTLDRSFGGTGMVTTKIASSQEQAFSVAVQADGKIVVAGGSFSSPNSGGGANLDFAVVRYEGGGRPFEADDPAAAGDCDDGDACTRDSCDPIRGCQNRAAPAATCLEDWAKGSLLVREDLAGKEKLRAGLLRGPALDLLDFGDPLQGGSTAYTVCVYDDADRLAGRLEVDRAGDRCGRDSCWKRTRAGTYVYRDKNAAADGARRLRLHAGDAGKSKILLRARNDSSRRQTALPTGMASSLAGSTRATVQVHGSDTAACFSATLGTVVRDTGQLFEAK